MCQCLHPSHGMGTAHPRGSGGRDYFSCSQITPVWQGDRCVDQASRCWAELAQSTLEVQGRGCSPACISQTFMEGWPLCARHCAGHWGHRDEEDTLSTCPCSSLPSLIPPSVGTLHWNGAPRTELSRKRHSPGAWESECPGFTSTTLGLSGLGHSLASGSPLLDKMGPLVLTHSDR